jgi:uncharacterized protein
VASRFHGLLAPAYSFGGVISFPFADLIILPILVMHDRTHMMLFVPGSIYVTMMAAGLLVEILFSLLGLVLPT